MGDEGREAQQRCLEAICDATRVTPTGDALTILENDVIGAETRTYSGDRSTHMRYADDDVSALLESLGVAALNQRLGYY